MAENATAELVLDLDISKAEVNLENFEESIKSLLNVVNNICKAIEKT